MDDRMHVIEWLPGYALGCLDEDEAGRVARHLAGCAACRAELQPYLAVAGDLALAVPQAAPPARVWRRIVKRIQPRPAQAPRAAWWQVLAGLLRGPVPAWTLAGLFLVAVLAGGGVWLGQRAGRAADGMQVVALAAADAVPDAAGRLVISSDGEYGTLVVEYLPALDEGHAYQLWLELDGQRDSGGLFTVDSHGYRAMEIAAPRRLAEYTAFRITAEPAGGSAAPTGEPVLSGRR